MAVGDTQGSNTTVVSIEPPADGDIRDFDQLTPPQQHAFLRLLDEKQNHRPLPTGLVVRYTAYYRIEIH